MDEKELAAALHGVICRWNHVDGCGWYYEFYAGEEDWRGRTHMRYLEKAREFIHVAGANGIDVTVQQLATLVQLIKNTPS